MTVLEPTSPARPPCRARRPGGVNAVFALLVGLASVLAAAAPVSAAGAGSAPTPRVASTVAPASEQWRWPVPPPIVVVAPFRAPPTPYASGHRGIDLAVEPGAVIRAPAAGTVSFAGPVAGRGVVAIDHGGGVVSAIEPVSAAVAEGAAVSAGDVIGAASTGGHCSTGCVHFGVRVDGEYVSPFLFLGGLPRAVLLPLE